MNNWTAAPQQLALAPHELHVWAVDLESLWAKAEEMAECLSPDELQQSQRFVSLQLTNNYLVSHAVLREILAKYLNCTPAELQMAANPQGKPYLENLPSDRKLEFNMSHTKGAALYAIGLQPVGVDIELLGRDVPVEEIAERFFTKAEYQHLLSLPLPERQRAFYQCWTLKEAFIKGIGYGLNYALNKFEVDFMSGQSPNCLKSVEGLAVKAQEWTLRTLSYSEHYTAAVSMQGDIHELQTWFFR